jgi:predicted GNAT family acetyltransferase
MTDQHDDRLRFRNDEAAQRYVAMIDDQVAGLIDYELRPGQIVFLHTETDPAFRGQGIAGRLTRFALDDVRERGLELVPLCSYTQHFLVEQPEYATLLA